MNYIEPHQYGIWMRPACLGTVPRGLEYSITAHDRDPGTEVLLPYTRHGILNTDRALTPAECKAFELVPILRSDADMESTVVHLVSQIAEYAYAYLADADMLAHAVTNGGRLSPDDVHQCIADPARLLAMVTERLQSA